MSAKLRFLSKLIGGAAALGLMVLMSGATAHAQSLSIQNLSVSWSPAGYNDVTDTVNFAVEFDGVVSGGGYGYTVMAYAYYYSGAYATGTLLSSTGTALYNYTGGTVYTGNNHIPFTINLNTPETLRASEPAGTQSILYQYVIYAGGGCYNGYTTWGGQTTASGPSNVVHG